MGEIRKDYILDRWVVISTGRGKRPKQFKKLEAKDVEVDYFAPGNEHMTPPEIGRTGTPKKWRMRWFANKFAALQPEGQMEIRTDNTYFTFSANYGYHEIIVETPEMKQLYDLPLKDIEELLGVYRQRITELGTKEGIKYVSVFKNHGIKGGTSIVHSHSQVAAINHVPKEIRDRVEACKRFGKCPYCDIINIEKGSLRQCFENKEFVAFAPYASRFNYEIWVFPKMHIRSLEEVHDLKQLAEIMHKILGKLKTIGADYNYYINYAPAGEDLHFHIEFAPRLATWAGFEIGTGDVINSVAPEDAAAFYRGDNQQKGKGEK